MNLPRLTFMAVVLTATPTVALLQGLEDPIAPLIETGGPPVQLELVATGMTARTGAPPRRECPATSS